MKLRDILIGLVIGAIVAPIALHSQAISPIANVPGTSRSHGGYPSLLVEIVDSNGNQITSFGGGTQYTEGDVDSTITGTALMFEGGSNTLVAATGDATNGLDVDVTRVQSTVTVDSELPAAAALSDSLSNPTTPLIGAAMVYWDSNATVWKRFEPAADGSSANGATTTLNSTASDGGTALTNSAQAIKASAGQLCGYYIWNPNSSAQFVQFYNTAAASVTVGTTNPLFMLTIPPTSAANLAFPYCIKFTNAGFSWSATSTAGGNGAPSSSLDAVAWYK